MNRRINYYKDLAADYSKAEPTLKTLGDRLIANAERFIGLKENILPAITFAYPLEQIEQENKEWWPTHCEALRRGRGDILGDEYTDHLVYFCQDGPFYGKRAGTQREANWWAIIAQGGVTMAWPIVMFHGEVVYFEWKCIDNETHETLAKGNVTYLRRGHRGGCYLKTEQLTFYRDVFASDELMESITT
jgi:hypothetical protein